MKALFLSFISFCLASCAVVEWHMDMHMKAVDANRNCKKNMNSKPDHPLPYQPNDWSEHLAGTTRFYTYTYNCFDGQYIQYTYKAEGCYAWELDDIFKSSGICD